MQLIPAAKIDQCSCQQSKCGDRQKCPGGKGGGLCAHGLLVYRRNADLQGNRSQKGLSLAFVVAFMTTSGFLLRWNRRKSRIARRRLTGRSERGHESHDCFDLVGRQVFAVCWHIPSALDDLTHELILRHPSSHRGEIGATMASYAFDRMTVPTLHVLHNHEALKLQWRAP